MCARVALSRCIDARPRTAARSRTERVSQARSAAQLSRRSRPAEKSFWAASPWLRLAKAWGHATGEGLQQDCNCKRARLHTQEHHVGTCDACPPGSGTSRCNLNLSKSSCIPRSAVLEVPGYLEVPGRLLLRESTYKSTCTCRYFSKFLKYYYYCMIRLYGA